MAMISKCKLIKLAFVSLMQLPFSVFAANMSMQAISGSYIVTFVPDTKSGASLIEAPNKIAISSMAANTGSKKIKFGDHSTSQSLEGLEKSLKIKGKVNKIFETISAAHLLISETEAAQLKKDPRVLSVTQDVMLSLNSATQTNPGWALDRLDQASTALNNQYTYHADGAGQTIYVLDSGLNLGNATVASEFGGRASIIYDVNGLDGFDCNGHGTQVASAAAGKTYGLAKGATIVAAKITTGCTGNSSLSTSILAFNWLAANAPKGTIVNWSQGIEYRDSNQKLYCSTGIFTELENSIRAAYNAGIIVVVSAGNDGCNTANYSPTRIPEAFVVGATSTGRFVYNQDARASWPAVNGGSRYGSNISVFAPGDGVSVLNYNGQLSQNSGTSFSAPYISGLFAVACQAAGTFCSTISDAGAAYNALRNIGVNNTVVNADGSPLPAGTPSRFINRQIW